MNKTSLTLVVGTTGLYEYSCKPTNAYGTGAAERKGVCFLLPWVAGKDFKISVEGVRLTEIDQEGKLMDQEGDGRWHGDGEFITEKDGMRVKYKAHEIGNGSGTFEVEFKVAASTRLFDSGEFTHSELGNEFTGIFKIRKIESVESLKKHLLKNDPNNRFPGLGGLLENSKLAPTAMLFRDQGKSIKVENRGLFFTVNLITNETHISDSRAARREFEKSDGVYMTIPFEFKESTSNSPLRLV